MAKLLNIINSCTEVYQYNVAWNCCNNAQKINVIDIHQLSELHQDILERMKKCNS